MIMPFIRLVAIYVVVIVAVVAFFKRDQIMDLTGWGSGASEPEQVVAVDSEETTTPSEPVAQADPIQQPTSAQPASEETPQPKIVQPTPDPAPQPAPDTQTASTQSTPVKERLTEARRAYWQGDLTGAETLYLALARDAPKNPDVNGELGNIYFAQRRFDKAADAYFVTGKLLMENGNPQQVGQIIGVLQSIAPQKAATLREMATN